ncbi:hypothetical protein IE53DRAFT_89531 [Violaceomyces palustris]|uniref:Uncharacterized protein n=1 Tax=Violaceomyces palustris TaxID=1673888 RepID=A0ACD0NXU6_9BASI|nr:hypothetical protein IE53DRAFT_89531 [Violaceomyces palustris]
MASGIEAIPLAGQRSVRSFDLTSAPLSNSTVEVFHSGSFIVNPSSDNVFLHIDAPHAHATIIGLIYFSMWMGALGWDIVSTISFDFRVLRETRWMSVPSAIHSTAYLLSRYASLAYIVTAVTNMVIMTEHCDSWMKGSISLFSIGLCSTMLVFCMRTISIWQLQPHITYPLVLSWLLIVAFAVLLPVMSTGAQLPSSQFCSWHLNGLYMIGVFAALLLFDFLCLVLTVLKLNKAGWKGLTRGLFPSSRQNFDSEDLKTMLLQRTTAFFFLQFLILISALLVYLLTETYSYKLMNIVACVAVGSSMAGRIFRRAWRQTREHSPASMNKPPSYYPAWAEEHRRAENSSDLPPPPMSLYRPGGVGTLPTAKRPNKSGDSLDFYVEGEFSSKAASSAMSFRSTGTHALRTPAEIYAAQHSRDRTGSELSPNLQGSTTALRLAGADAVESHDNATLLASRDAMHTAVKNHSQESLQALTLQDHAAAVAIGQQPTTTIKKKSAQGSLGSRDGRKIRPPSALDLGRTLKAVVSAGLVSAESIHMSILPHRAGSEDSPFVPCELGRSERRSSFLSARPSESALRADSVEAFTQSPGLREDLNRPLVTQSRLFVDSSERRNRGSQGQSDGRGGMGDTKRNQASRLGTAESHTGSTTASSVSFHSVLDEAEAAHSLTNPPSVDKIHSLALAGHTEKPVTFSTAKDTNEMIEAIQYRLATLGSSRRGSQGRGSDVTDERSGMTDEPGPFDKRKLLFVASPPMPAGPAMAGRDESRKVYDFDSVKAAAMLNLSPSPLSSTVRLKRPATTSSALQSSYPYLEGSSSAAVSTNSLLGDITPQGSPATAQGSTFGHPGKARGHLTTRPQTAPTLPSPVNEFGHPGLSTSTMTPTQALVTAGGAGVTEPCSTLHLWDKEGQSLLAKTSNDNALFAFRQVVEDDARQRSEVEGEADGQASGVPVRARTCSKTRLVSPDGPERLGSSCGSSQRPRTARGTASASFGAVRPGTGGDCAKGAVDDSAEKRASHGRRRSRSEAANHHADGVFSRQHVTFGIISGSSLDGELGESPSRAGTIQARPQTSSESNNLHRSPKMHGSSKPSTAGGANRHETQAADTTRPSTSAGEDVKPFGFGISHTSISDSRRSPPAALCESTKTAAEEKEGSLSLSLSPSLFTSIKHRTEQTPLP